MQEKHLQFSESIDAKEILELRHYLGAVNYKFYLATISLEQLWSLGHSRRFEVLSILENGLTEVNTTDDDLLLASFALEGFLFQATSFLDIYMLYICIFLRTGYIGSMTSQDRFYKVLKRAPSKDAAKAEDVRQYFEKRVYGDGDYAICRNDWGVLLRSLRDRIAHKDIIRPSFESQEKLYGDVRFNWPTVQGLTLDRFCQMLQNCMFSLLEDLSPILYELPWKTGKYQEGLWDNLV